MSSQKKPNKVVSCIDCGREYEVTYQNYFNVKGKDPSNPPFRCPECAIKYRSQKMKERMANMSPEEKAAMYKKAGDNHSKTLAKMSKEEKDARMARVNAGRDEWLKNETEEERQRISKIHADSNRRRWESKSEEEKQHERDAAKERWNNSSDEFKQQHAQYTIDMWKNKSEEELKEIKEKMSYVAYMRHVNMSEEEKNAMAAKIRATNIRNYEALSDKEKSEYSKKHIRGERESTGLNDSFRKMFEELDISECELIPECYLSWNKDVRSKRWDFAIKKGDKIIAAVDLDGELYHADKCDYNSTYDEIEDASRGLSVMPGIMRVIIPEGRLPQGMKYLMNILPKGYQAYVNYNALMCTMMPFPYPKYSDPRLEDSFRVLEKMDLSQSKYENLSLQPRYGDRLMFHFHESIWNDHMKNKKSPSKAWEEIDVVTDMIDKGILINNEINKNKICQGFILSDTAPRVDVFSAATARVIIGKYLSKFDTIFDPFSGYGSILLGTISLNKHYIGQDISLIQVNESNKMLEFLRSHNEFIKSDLSASLIRKDVCQSSGEYQCLFTCPPGGDEVYQDIMPSTNSYDDWIDICLERFKCQRYVFVVKYTKKYSRNIVDMIETELVSKFDRKFVVVINR